jgi:LuxR family transcriptional regulator, maltose regulon positive regulatory protein
VEALFPFTKFLPPQLDDRVVTERVVAWLQDAVASHPLTVVSAPAGSGKTTALSAWVREADGPVVWVRMTGDDNAPAAAAAALLAAARHTIPDFGVRLELVLGQGESTGPTHLLTSLVNDLGEVPDLKIVLDDFHEITDPACLELFDALLDHLPPRVRLLVASRTEPGLSLPRRRVRGEVAEIGMDDLRLDDATIRALLGREAEVADDVLAAVVAASGGWPAAVRLAMAHLPTSRDVDPVVSIQGDLWKFLAEEVLDAQPPDLRSFLLETAILDELSPTVCASLTGRDDAVGVLDELDRRNLFLARYMSEDGPVWRYHDLFSSFLLDHLLAERGEDEVAELHRRAAEVLSPTRAVPHLLAAGSHERAAELVEEITLQDMDPSILSVVLPWVEALPSELIEQRHMLALLLAWGDELGGQAPEIIARLEPLHARLLDEGDHVAASEIGLELATAHLMLGDFERVGAMLDVIEDVPLEGWWQLAAMVLRMHWCRDVGDWAGSSTHLAAAFDVALGSDDPVLHKLLASGLSSTHLFADQGPAWLLDRTERLVSRLPDRRRLVSLSGLRPVVAGAALLRLDLDTAADEVRRCLVESHEVGRLAWTHQEAEQLFLMLSLAADDHAAVRGVVDEAFARMPSSPVDLQHRYTYAYFAMRLAWLRKAADRIDVALQPLADPGRPEEDVTRVVGEALRARLDGDAGERTGCTARRGGTAAGTTLLARCRHARPGARIDPAGAGSDHGCAGGCRTHAGGG